MAYPLNKLYTFLANLYVATPPLTEALQGSLLGAVMPSGRLGAAVGDRLTQVVGGHTCKPLSVTQARCEHV
jgi:hypothetical protein